MSKNGFNDEQNLALENPVDVDLQISAGAGSGKTKTLSEKVMRLIEEGLKPSELLILTFTNNAAHEMKERIIAKFINRSDIALELASAHIQTFDSFSQYLVSMYSNRLNIAEQISVINDNVIKTKKKEIVDELFDEYYLDSHKKEAFLQTLLKFNLRDDSVSKLVILDLIDQIEKLPTSERETLFNDYDNKYLSRETFDLNVHQLVEKGKSIIIDTILNAYFYEQYFDAIEEVDYLTLKEVFKNKDNFNKDYRNLIFKDNVLADPLYKELLSLIDLSDLDFIDKVKEFNTKNSELIKRRSPRKIEGKKEVAAQSVLREAINETQTSKLLFISKLDDIDKEYEKVLYFKDDIHLYLDIVKEALKRIEDYKKITNSYTFSDISHMALSLMIEPQYEDIAEEIRTRFKFIMVDEYQDTNDLQELFIESLLKPNKKGERSHLFCVGDAKQSIYAFRDSNVQLFKDRQNKYDSLPDSIAKALPMNKNYRSGKKLLEDINHIFNFYMTVNHGGIAYHQIGESLQYDDEINLYNKPYIGFGIYRITSVSSLNNDNASYGAKEWEARAIAADILSKYQKYDVSVRTDKGNEIRKANYSDFCILVGVKACVDLYQKVFQEYSIPLNCKIEKDLNELGVVTVIKSLLGMMNYILLDKQSDPIFAHMFASVARSYLYEYDDQKIYDLLNDSSKQYFALSNDPIVIQITKFVEEYKDSSFSVIFIEMLSEFGIIEKLYKIGDVDDSLSKIESLYQMAVSSEKSGEGINEFVQLMDNVDKYKTELSSESLYQIENAVDLMTIHGSKGLERKIVYMPCSFNYITKGKIGAKPDYTFSRNLGILLPYYNYHFDEDRQLEDINNNFSIQSVNHLIYTQLDEERKIKEDEHVRLFYVALTRAENSVYIVGDLPKLNENVIKKQKSEDRLYGMLSYMPFYVRLNDEFIKRKIIEGIVKKEPYDLYLEYVEYMKHISIDLTNDDLDFNQYNRYMDLWKDRYQSLLFKKITEYVNEIEKELFINYHQRFTLINDYDSLANIFAMHYYNDDSIKSVNELLNYKKKKFSDEDDDEDEFNFEINKDNVKNILDIFKNSIKSGTNFEFLHLSFSQDSKKKGYENGVPILLKDDFLLIFIKFFDNEQYFKSISFKTDEYEDKVVVYDYKQYPLKEKSFIPPTLNPLNINDEPIEFKQRIHLRASKEVSDEELPSQELLDYGVKLHRLLELVDLKTKDTSFIKDKKEKELIDDALKLHIFDNLANATIFKEYGYYDDELLTSGFIDLLIVKNDEYYIIDYKTRNIYDSAYDEQLHTYARNVSKLFNVEDTNKIHMYLLSIETGKIRKVVD